MNRFKIVIGDYGRDGHGMFETFILESNVPKSVIDAQYTELMIELGISPSDFCEDYEDDTISEEDLIKMGLNPIDYKDLILDDESTLYTFDAERYCELIVDYITTHRPNTILRIVDDPMQLWSLGGIGYGLFIQ